MPCFDVPKKRPPVRWLVFWLMGLFMAAPVSAQQTSVSRIEQMPNLPQPYHMRNWKRVAAGYDSLVFDFNLTGQYLPLIWWQTHPVNYPNHWSFGLHTVVGTTVPSSAEAINVLPAVISATLAGIDKSNQNGQNWVLMCEEWFNRRPEENVYLNHPAASSGNDWWYDTMPNLFFYQLYALYSGQTIGDFDYQFTTVADRWLTAVGKMGGSTTPWHVPFMNYRAWHLASMTPNASGVPEPEAAGAIAWLLYMAYHETGHTAYRIGAEWAMEFLDNWQTNPAYELQLAYGTYLAARMNAELGTAYHTEKFVNWCFEVGSLRNWGAIVGNWGGYDCSGLIGEVSGNDYAFSMNTFQQVGALVPLVRYDDRFARAIGKWVLNAANAARLFYPDFLPDENQDSEQWAHQYDPRSYIAHEAMRETYQGYSPYATGDAISGGWGMTNLTLYSSSHAGILGGVVDTTGVKGLLRLNALKTDYFHGPAYPTFLFYNPYSVDTTVLLPVGSGLHDIYDAAANQFLLTGVSDTALLTIPADDAVLAVITPAGGTVSYRLDKMLINGVVVDYHAGQSVSNYPPRIKALAAQPEIVAVGGLSTLYCTAMDLDGDTLAYSWTAPFGSLSGSGKTVIWTAPPDTGTYAIRAIVSDGNGAADSAAISLRVVAAVNHPPQITSLSAHPRKIDLGAGATLACAALDPDGDSLVYSWSAPAGTLMGNGDTVRWTAPALPGNYPVTCRVTDGHGGADADSIVMVVRDFSAFQPGKLVAYYPFNGNANDASGNNHHGTVHGAVLTSDRFGNPRAAYWFDGSDDFISVPNDDSLNFRQAISLDFWMKADNFFSREAFLLSHGSWQNRWKVSIIPSHHLRWTIKTDQGVVDVDSDTELQAGIWYNVACFYDGSDFEIYLNGELDNFKSWGGLLLPTPYDLTMAQMLPGNSSYNFRGVLDEVRIYDYGLSVPEIQNLFQLPNRLTDGEDSQSSQDFRVYPGYPNPFNGATRIRYYLPRGSEISIAVYDVTGRKIADLAAGRQNTGFHSVRWNAAGFASGVYFYRITAGRFTYTGKLLLIR